VQLEEHWQQIMYICAKGMGNFAFATVNEDGTPHLTPIGSLILRDDCTGFYFEEYPSSLPANLERDNRLSILAVDFRKSFWISSFFLGRYTHPVAVRLNGRAGERREATEEELTAFHDIIWVKLLRVFRFKGYEVGWKPLRHVRDICFDSFEPCEMGAMSRGHWNRSRV
jgi:hypothetical protein